MTDDVTKVANTLPMDLGLRSLMKLNKKFVKKKTQFTDIHGLEIEESDQMFSARDNPDAAANWDVDVDCVNPILPYNKKTLNKIFGVVPIKDNVRGLMDQKIKILMQQKTKTQGQILSEMDNPLAELDNDNVIQIDTKLAKADQPSRKARRSGRRSALVPNTSTSTSHVLPKEVRFRNELTWSQRFQKWIVLNPDTLGH